MSDPLLDQQTKEKAIPVVLDMLFDLDDQDGRPTYHAARALLGEPVHDVSVIYTRDDDGVHVWCSCGWDSGGMFTVTPERLLELSNQHRTTCDCDAPVAEAMLGEPVAHDLGCASRGACKHPNVICHCRDCGAHVEGLR